MEAPRNSLLKGIVEVLSLLESVTENEVDLYELVLTTGWDLNELAGFNVNDLSLALSPLSANLQTLISYVENPPASFSEVRQAFNTAKSAFVLLEQLKHALENLDLEGPDKNKLLEFGADLLNLLTVITVRTQSPVIFQLLFLLTLIDFDENDLEAIAGEDGKLIRYPSPMPRLKLGRLSEVLSDPVDYFQQYYFPNRLQTDEDALRASYDLFPRISSLLREFGVISQMGFSTEHGVDLGQDSNDLAQGMLTLFFPENFDDIDFGLSMALSPLSRGNLGLVLMPFGNLHFTKNLEGWQVNFHVSAEIEAFSVGPEGVTLPEGLDSSQVKLNLQVVKVPEAAGQAAFLIGGRTGSRLEIGTLNLETTLSLVAGDFEFKTLLQASQGLFALMPGDSDGFLSSLLPEEGILLDFDLGLGWSNQTGLYFKGGVGLEAQYVFHKSILGFLRLQRLRLKLDIDDSSIGFITDTDIEVKLGPITAVIHQIGLRSDLGFVSEGGNAGIANASIDFKSPTGLTLYIDGGGFKGGGSLNFEPEQGRYTGFLELSFQDSLSLKAIGMLTTQLPNGQEGYSLLIVITAEFSPVQLGFGFTLNGVGGLLALNRTVNAERLRTGVRDNTLSSILFPQNIESNIDQIISDLRQVFPPQSDRFVFGPMLKIGWGSPSIITIDMGLLIEVPNPVRMQILGVLRAILPAEEEAVLRLQVNFLGEVDFEQKQLSFDASLYDSKLLAFTLSGDMAIRMYWGEKANFLLTVGGFHPAYQPPPMNLPDIRRLTLALLDGDNPRLKLETYFAVTSNTVQFGAKAELYAAAWKVNIYGFISFDVLFQFSPFRFIADVSAMLALRYGTSSFATIKLAFTLEGPTPWKAKGTASFKICWFFTLKVRFNKTFGIDQQIQLPAIPVLPGLLAAFNNPDNWEGVLPAGRYQLESFKDNEGLGPEQVLVHPIGILQVSQKLVPLNIRIQKFGYQRPADADQFSIEHIRLEAQPVQAPPAREDFAPAQFFEYKDEEKLSLPAFQSFDSGIRIADLDQASIEYAVAKAVKYELKYIDSIRDRRLDPAAGQQTLDPASFNTWTLQGAVAQSDLSYANNRKPVLAPQEVAIAEESYGVVNTSDLRLYDNNSLLANKIEAKLRRDQLIAENPALAETIQVLPAFEISS